MIRIKQIVPCPLACHAHIGPFRASLSEEQQSFSVPREMAARLGWRWPDSKKINQIPDTTQGSICMQLVSTRPHSGSHWGLVASPLSAFIGHVRQPKIVDYGHSPPHSERSIHAIPDKCGDRRSGTGLGSGIHDTLNHMHKRSSFPRPQAFFPLRAAQRRSVRVCLFPLKHVKSFCHPPATRLPPARHPPAMTPPDETSGTASRGRRRSHHACFTCRSVLHSVPVLSPSQVLSTPLTSFFLW